MHDRFLEIRGLRLHVVEWPGGGRPILLLHGGSAHARWWDAVARRLAPKHRVLALDLRGHGDSDWSPDGAYGLDQYVPDVEAVLHELHLERPALVGHSLGSFVALRHAIEHPGALRAVAVVDGRASFGERGFRTMQILRMFPPGRYATLEEAARRFATIPRETTATAEVLHAVAMESFRQSTDETWTPKFDRETVAAHRAFDFRARLGAIDCPVLFARGEESRMLSREAAAEFAAACRKGSWIEIPGAHHHVLLDRPAELAAVLDGFLSRSDEAFGSVAE